MELKKAVERVKGLPQQYRDLVGLQSAPQVRFLKNLRIANLLSEFIGHKEDCERAEEIRLEVKIIPGKPCNCGLDELLKKIK